PGAGEFGTRTETKNVNSLRSVERAARFEVCRQASVLQAGGVIRQETRHFDELTGTTSSGRAKETAEDYRYFPEPDLVPVAPSAEWVEEIRASLPELPWVRRDRLQTEWAFTDLEMRDLVAAGGMALVTATVDAGAGAGDARSWWMSYLSQEANATGVELEELAITPAQVAAVIALVADGKLTTKLARQVVDGVLAGEGEPADIVAARGLAVVSDDVSLQKAIDDALAAQPDVADTIRSGKLQAIGAVVGAVMRATRGQADAGRVRELTLKTLGVEG
ncbi:MAG: Asp-tRNA(Asn)/Glu-tRNA(Gln) amidotransferase GatCAB subunit B, partial [Nakamurella sp.]